MYHTLAYRKHHLQFPVVYETLSTTSSWYTLYYIEKADVSLGVVLHISVLPSLCTTTTPQGGIQVLIKQGLFSHGLISNYYYQYCNVHTLHLPYQFSCCNILHGPM